MMLDGHLHDGMVQQVLHGEVALDQRADVDAHLTACVSCRGRVAAAADEERELFARLRSLDHAVPARSLTLVRQPVGTTWSLRAIGRVAAGILLAVVLAGVAYAAPGSPLPSLIRRLGQALAPTGASDGRVSTTMGTPDSSVVAAPTSAAGSAVPGISVEPGERFSIEFPEAARGGTVVVSIGEGAELVVTSSSKGVSFTSDPDRLGIVTADSTATVEIEIPRSAPDVEIRIAGRRVFHKRGNRTTATLPAERDGRFRLRLDPPRPALPR